MKCVYNNDSDSIEQSEKNFERLRGNCNKTVIFIKMWRLYVYKLKMSYSIKIESETLLQNMK